MKQAAMMLIVLPVLFAGCGMPAVNRTAWPYLIEVEGVAAEVSAALDASRGVIGPGSYVWEPRLAVQSDGRAVMGYYHRLQIIPPYEIGEMRRAVISGGNVATSSLLASYARLSGFALLPDDSLAFFAQNAVENAFHVFDKDGGQRDKFVFPAEYIPGFTRPVLSPGGILESVMWSRADLADDWKLGLARYAGGAWVLPAADIFIQEPDSPTPWRIEWADGTEPHLAYDGSGDPWVAYERNNVIFPESGGVEHTDHIFMAARRKQGTWTNTELFSLPEVHHTDGGCDRGPFIAFDRAGTLHLVVYCVNRMFYASKPEGGPWSVEEVFLDYDYYNTEVDFALEREAARDVPSILFFSRSNGAAVAQRKNGRWTIDPVDSEGHVLDGALTTDANGKLWAVYGRYDPGSNMWYKMIAHK